MNSLCRVEMFGGLRVLRGERTWTRFRTQKASSLLAYLALRLGQSQSRERLIDLFWPDRALDEGRNNLSTTLSLLRRQIEIPSDTIRIILADHQSVQLNSRAVSTDVAEFEALIDAASKDPSPSSRAEDLGRAAALYRADLLPGNYEDWAVREQQRLAERYVAALWKWRETLEEIGDTEAALSAVKRILEADPFREEAWTAAMRLHALLGRPAAAIETYRQLEACLKAEFGTPPSTAARELVELLRRDPNALRIAAAESDAASDLPKTVTATPGPVAPQPRAPSQVPVLPAHLSRFFGRRHELQRLHSLLDRPGTRLITLTGPGGAGKTRLAIEAARSLTSKFDGRVWFVSLAELPDSQFVLFAIASTLQLHLGSETAVVERVVETLSVAPSMLVMDNLEHLLLDGQSAKGDRSQDSAAEIVQMLLARVPHLVCLATSRQPLHLEGEQEFPVPPLSVPPVTETPEALAQCDSVELYLDRLQLAKPDFVLTASNADAVATLCRRLEGMPLAIEMAAAWGKTLPPAKMLERLEKQLDLLFSRRRDLPARHQSLRATIEWSYQLLPPELQKVFARLGVFRGRWTLDAAEFVCAADLSRLYELQEHSLLVVDAQGDEAGWRMLEPLREYALERLDEREERDAALRRHALYYLGIAEQANASLVSGGAEQAAWYRRLDAELDNLRAALDFCLTTGARSDPALLDPQAGLRLAAALRLFFHSRGMREEATLYLRRALSNSDAQARTSARARALFTLAWIGGGSDSRECLDEALAIHRDRGDRTDVAQMLHEIGCIISLDDNEDEAARPYFEESLKLLRELGERRRCAGPIYLLGLLAARRGDDAEARRRFEEAIVIDREFAQKAGLAPLALAQLAVRSGDYAEAHSLLRELLDNGRALHHLTLVCHGLTAAAMLALAQAQPERAARLAAAAESIELKAGLQPDMDRPSVTTLRTDLRSKFANLWREGLAMTMEQAVEYACSST